MENKKEEIIRVQDEFIPCPHFFLLKSDEVPKLQLHNALIIIGILNLKVIL
jgi:hypothetical protein